MSGNSFGNTFVVTTCGESHGPALLAIVDGCPPGLALSESDIQPDVDRRKTGVSKFTSQRREDDRVQILSGVFEGVTTGTPIGLMIENKDHRSSDYSKIKDVFRPGHADFSYQKKYGIRDYRGGGRSSARETVMRVAAAAIARKYLRQHCDTEIQAYLSQVGDIYAEKIDYNEINNNPFFFPDSGKVESLEKLLTQLRRDGDSIGARINVVVRNAPVGLGAPVFHRLDADIACALMGINAAKGVEIGEGFSVVNRHGSRHRDEINKDGFQTNNAGGILGGISTGQEITASVAFKPTSSIVSKGNTVDVNGNETEVSTKGRHDPCVGIRAVPIVEAMMALVLMDHYLLDRAQNADVRRNK